MNENVQHLLDNPDWFLFHIDGERAYFIEMNRMAFYRTVFCDSRIKPVSKTIRPVSLAGLIGAFEAREKEQPQLAFIFHMAHVGSTLLARALDMPGRNLICREPQVLRQVGVSLARHELPHPFGWNRVLDLVMHLLAKSYSKNESVIIKANVPVNFIIPDLLGKLDCAHAIVLYTTLENYLLALCKSEDHKQWVCQIIRELAPGWKRVSGFGDAELESLSLPESIGFIWLAQVAMFHRALAEHDRIRTLDAEVLFTSPGRTLAASFEFFGESVADEKLQEIISGDVFFRHSKDPDRMYTNEKRIREREELRSTLMQDAHEAQEWANDNAHRFQLKAGLKMTEPLERASLVRAESHRKPDT